MKAFFPALLAFGCLLGINAAQAGETPAPEGAAAYIITPADGAKVTSPVKVVFGLKGMGVAPAGVEKEHTGHHHLLIDTPMPTRSASTSSAMAAHLHFGKGETEAMVELAPGAHTLQLLLGDHNHIPHKQPVASKRITITVE